MYPVRVGINSAAKMAKITSTTISSTKVKPFLLFLLNALNDRKNLT